MGLPTISSFFATVTLRPKIKMEIIFDFPKPHSKYCKSEPPPNYRSKGNKPFYLVSVDLCARDIRASSVAQQKWDLFRSLGVWAFDLRNPDNVYGRRYTIKYANGSTVALFWHWKPTLPYATIQCDVSDTCLCTITLYVRAYVKSYTILSLVLSKLYCYLLITFLCIYRTDVKTTYEFLQWRSPTHCWPAALTPSNLSAETIS